MSDTIVSIRMPRRLLKELQDHCERKNYLDTSEALRSIVRTRWLEATQLGLGRMEAMRDQLVVEKAQRKRAELVRQIEALSSELKKLGEDVERIN